MYKVKHYKLFKFNKNIKIKTNNESKKTIIITYSNLLLSELNTEKYSWKGS